MNKWRYAVLAGVTGVTLAMLLLSAPRTHTVVRTEDGFEPNRIAIATGDKIRFVNQSRSPTWPASDSHPSHALYKEFDPRGPIPPGQSWTFTFTRAGTWKFHDHMRSTISGSVVVEGTEESIEECVAKNADNEGIYPECWEKEIEQIIQTKGLPAAFEWLENRYESSAAFRINCHDVMHAAGKYAYDAYATSGIVITDPGTAYCGFGFYHGFIEAMQIIEGSQQFAASRAYCEKLTAVRPGVRGTCYHGVGHAVFDSLDAKQWGDPLKMTEQALAACELVGTDTFDRAQCASGIYNSYANAMSAENYYLSYDDLRLEEYCGSQPTDYQPFCYSEVGIGYLIHYDLPHDEALAFIRSLEPASLTRMLYVYFAHYAKSRINTLDFPAMASFCAAFDEQPLWQSCVSGTLQGIREESLPTKAYLAHFAFCSHLPMHMRHSCASDVWTYAGAVRETDTFIEACLSVPGVPVSLCRGPG